MTRRLPLASKSSLNQCTSRKLTRFPRGSAENYLSHFEVGGDKPCGDTYPETNQSSINAVFTGQATHPEELLLGTDDHRVGADQMLYSGFAEACFLHPSGAVSAGVVEAVGGFNQHIQAHQQSK